MHGFAHIDQARLHVGDLFCDNVSIADFQKTCRAPLYPERWNIWRVVRTTRDNPSIADLHDTASAVMAKWFGIPAGQITEKVDHLSVTVLDKNSVQNPYGSTPLVIDRTHACSQAMYLSGNDHIQLGMKFVYRGTDTSMAWPAWKEQIYNPWCPVEADWLCEAIYAPPAATVPPEPTLGSELGAAVPDALKPTKTLTGFLFWLGLGLGGAVLIAHEASKV